MSLRCNLIALRLNFTEEQGLPSPVASSTWRIALSYFESGCEGEQYNQWIRPHTNLSWGSGKTHEKLSWPLFSLRRNFLPHPLAPILERNNFHGSVVVQANTILEDSLGDASAFSEFTRHKPSTPPE
jgi:hypothetical protein